MFVQYIIFINQYIRYSFSGDDYILETQVALGSQIL